MVFHIKPFRKVLEDTIRMYFAMHPDRDLCEAATEISAISGHIVAVCYVVGEKRGWTEKLREKMEGNMKFYGIKEVRE